MSFEQYRPQKFTLLPEVVKNLLIINALFFFATYVLNASFGYDLTDKLGLYYIGSPKFHPYQFITHLFMHGNFIHLLSNMFMLWMFGNVLENYWGAKRFLIYYLITGLGAAFIHSLVVYYDNYTFQQAIQIYSSSPSIDTFATFVKDYVPDAYSPTFHHFIDAWVSNPTNPQFIEQSKSLAGELGTLKMNIPTVGASGAVFGVLLAFGMLFPNTILYIYFALPVKAKYFVIFYGLLELYLGFQNSQSDNVAHFAHLGGMLFGFILLKYWNTKNRQHFY